MRLVLESISAAVGKEIGGTGKFEAVGRADRGAKSWLRVLNELKARSEDYLLVGARRSAG